MSNVPNLNNIKWKIGSLNQQLPVVKKNERTEENVSISRLFRAFPPRIYRKELVFNSGETTSCYASINKRVSDFEIPGGAINTQTTNNVSAPQYFIQRNDNCPYSPCPNPNSVQSNSLRRVRGSSKISNNYFTSSHQYLNNRNVSNNRQQFSILREELTADAGTKVYSTNGLPPSCNESKKYSITYFKPNNPQFSQQGAVSGGDYITRLKYDSARTTAASFTNIYGTQLPGYGEATKAKYGYTLTCTPTFPKNSDTMVPC